MTNHQDIFNQNKDLPLCVYNCDGLSYGRCNTSPITVFWYLVGYNDLIIST